MKYFFLQILNLLPLSIRKWPYEFSYLLVRLITFNAPFQLWHRHGVRMGVVTLGLSDLDLSAWLDEDKSCSKCIKDAASTLNSIQNFPFFKGEINFYLERECKLLLPWAPRFLLMRDPELSLKLGIGIGMENGPLMVGKPEPIAIHIQKNVYLLRLLDSDRINLIRYFKLRVNKWRKHFHEINAAHEGQSFHDLDSFSAQLVNVLSFPKSVLSHDRLNQTVFQYFHCRASLDDLYEKGYAREIMILWFHRWLTLSLNRGKLERDLEQVKNESVLSLFEIEMICEHVRYEIWGLLSQFHLMAVTRPDVASTLINHFNFIKRVLTEIDSQEEGRKKIENVLQGIEIFVEIIKYGSL